MILLRFGRVDGVGEHLAAHVQHKAACITEVAPRLEWVATSGKGPGGDANLQSRARQSCTDPGAAALSSTSRSSSGSAGTTRPAFTARSVTSHPSNTKPTGRHRATRTPHCPRLHESRDGSNHTISRRLSFQGHRGAWHGPAGWGLLPGRCPPNPSGVQYAPVYSPRGSSSLSVDVAVVSGGNAALVCRNKSNWANRLDKPPFEAFAVTCGITVTFGACANTPCRGHRLPREP